LGDRWSLVVVRDIFNGKKSFGELLESPEKISSSVLANRLKLLENKGIAKHIFSIEDKKVKWYYLTDRGIDLYPLLYEMVYWSERNLDAVQLISKDWFNRDETFDAEKTITFNQNKYKKKRERLLELQKLV